MTCCPRTGAWDQCPKQLRSHLCAGGKGEGGSGTCQLKWPLLKNGPKYFLVIFCLWFITDFWCEHAAFCFLCATFFAVIVYLARIINFAAKIIIQIKRKHRKSLCFTALKETPTPRDEDVAELSVTNLAKNLVQNLRKSQQIRIRSSYIYIFINVQTSESDC